MALRARILDEARSRRRFFDSQPNSMRSALRAMLLVATVAAEDVHIHTPLVWSSKLSERVGSSVYLKMDALQPGGSFKARGIGRLCTHFRDEGVTSLVSSSCANAGMAVAVAGRALGVDATIVASDVDRECRLLDTFRQLGANVVLHGAEWNDADEHARELGASQGAASNPNPNPNLTRTLTLTLTLTLSLPLPLPLTLTLTRCR